MKYYVTDNDTGQSYVLEGDSPPTEQELEEIFSSMGSDQSYGLGLIKQAGQGVMLGLSDEIGGGLAAIAGAVKTGNKFSDVYRDIHGNLKRQRDQFSRENPKAALAAEIGGGLATGGLGFGKVLGAKALQTAAPLTKLGATAGVGAAEGGIYGAGTADIDNRLEGGAIGASVGAIAAPVGGALVNAGIKGGRSLLEAGKRRLAETPKTQAVRVAREFADAGGLDAEQIAMKMERLGPKGTLADTDDSLRMLAKAGMSKAGPMQQRGRTLTNRRQIEQQPRLMKTIENITGKNAGEYGGEIMDVANRKKAKAGPVYDQAYSEGVKMTPVIEEILSRRLVKKAAREGTDYAEAYGAGPYGDSFGLLSKLHYTKMGIDDAIGAAMRKGANSKVGALLNAKHELLREIKKQNPTYIRANEIWSSEAGLENALTFGFKLMSKSPDEIASVTSKFSPAEMEMFRLGGVKSVGNRLDAIGGNMDAVGRLTGSAENRKRIGYLFEDNKQALQFIGQLSKEDEFTQTRRLFNQQSITEPLSQARKLLDEGADPSIIARAAMQDPSAFIGMAAKLLKSPGASPEMIKELGDILFKEGMQKEEILRIFGSTALKAAIGQDYNKIVAPYIRSMVTPAVMAEG